MAQPRKRPRSTEDDPVAEYAHAVVAGELSTGRLARLACERHLRDLTPLLVELSKLIPQTTIEDLAREHPDLGVNTSRIPEAVEASQRAWTRENTATNLN